MEKTPKKGQWVQTERSAHEAWAKLIEKSPTAARLMHVLTSQIGDHNAVVMSQKTMATLLGCHRNTVNTAVKLLADDNWIEVRQVGGKGSANAYIINDQVAWTGKRDGLRWSLFSAAVIINSDEQLDKDSIGADKALRRLPRIGEIQAPAGDGLLPPSQPAFPGLEPDLPAAGFDPETGEIIDE